MATKTKKQDKDLQTIGLDKGSLSVWRAAYPGAFRYDTDRVAVAVDHVAATNGRILAIVKHPDGSAKPPDWPGAFLPMSVVKDAANLLPRGSRFTPLLALIDRVGEDFQLTIRRQKSEVQLTGAAKGSRTFPDYQALIPTDAPFAVLGFDPKYVKMLADIAQACAGNPRNNVFLHFEIRAQNKPVLVRASGDAEARRRFIGLIMPIDNHENDETVASLAEMSMDFVVKAAVEVCQTLKASDCGKCLTCRARKILDIEKKRKARRANAGDRHSGGEVARSDLPRREP